MKKTVYLVLVILGVACSHTYSTRDLASTSKQRKPIKPKFFKCPISKNIAHFDANPEEFTRKHLIKFNSDCKPTKIQVFWDEKEVEAKQYVLEKDAARKKFCANTENGRICLDDIEPGRAPYQGNDNYKNLVDNTGSYYDTLESIERANLKSAKTPSQPWSDDYWAIAKGVLGFRYNNQAMQFAVTGGDDTWKKLYDHYKANPAANLIQSGKVDQLSPAEKYDLLVGDKNWTLTKQSWEQGRYYFENYGKVETWMGICHGWAPAAYMLKRPKKAITVKAKDGTPIKFYPADIKALASMIWASGKANTKFIGGRCNDKDVQTDSNGRITSQKCFDNNPASWHLSVVNQVGKAKRPLVIDATYDYEVWNFPVFRYSYTYFNPVTKSYTDDLRQAKVDYALYRNRDKFASYRTKTPKYIVGVVMEVEFSIETHPHARVTDTPANDWTRTVQYTYDLELDANGKIFGGEWYDTEHPDFVWTPPKGEKAKSMYENYLSDIPWRTGQSVPDYYTKFAQGFNYNDRKYPGASSEGQPLGAVVEKLIQLAQ